MDQEYDNSDEKFVDSLKLEKNFEKLSLELKCPICLNYLNEPTITKCNHLFCLKCIEKSFEITQLCPVCKMDTEIIGESLKFVKNMIDNLLFNCSNDKCNKLISYNNISNHMENECEFRQITCKCSKAIMYNNLNQHMKECSHRFIMCNYCSNLIPYIEMDNHVKNRCPELEYYCPNNCDFKCKYKYLIDHLNICKYHIVKCKYNIIGCNFSDIRCNIKIHERTDHFNLIKNLSNYNYKRGTYISLLNDKLNNEREIQIRSWYNNIYIDAIIKSINTKYVVHYIGWNKKFNANINIIDISLPFTYSSCDNKYLLKILDNIKVNFNYCNDLNKINVGDLVDAKDEHNKWYSSVIVDIIDEISVISKNVSEANLIPDKFNLRNYIDKIIL